MFLCCYCLRIIEPPLRLTQEHLVPLSWGGNNNMRNLRTCCHQCNTVRGRRNYEEFIMLLRMGIFDDIFEQHTIDTIIIRAQYYSKYIEEKKEFLYKPGRMPK